MAFFAPLVVLVNLIDKIVEWEIVRYPGPASNGLSSANGVKSANLLITWFLIVNLSLDSAERKKICLYLCRVYVNDAMRAAAQITPPAATTFK